MNFSEITKEYKYRTELHAHSFPVSKCGKFSSDEVVRIYAAEGCNALVLTNHLTEKLLIDRTVEEATEFYLSDYYKAKKAGEELGVNVIFGVEIRFSGTSNDYLIYGVSPDDVPTLLEFCQQDIETFYKGFKNENNVILHAHPFRSNMEPTPLGSVDGIETLNLHPGHNSKIGFAAKFARQHKLTVCGGSDFHEEGRHALCFARTKELPKDSHDIAKAILSNEMIYDLSGHIVIPYLYD